MKFSSSLLLIATVIALSSCSSNEGLLPEEPITSSLEKFTVKRDYNGSYYVDYDVKDDTKAEYTKDAITNTNQFDFYSSNDNIANRSANEDLAIENGQLNIGFTDTNINKQRKITIFDDDIVMARNTEANDMLAAYSITDNTDGTYSLDFTVEDNVTVDFVYNEAEDIYEIHLEEGTTNETTFDRTFTRDEGAKLNIDFVNHDSYSNRTIESSPPRKPVIIIDEGEDG